MTAVTLGVWPEGSPEWLAARQGRVGGSDIGVILGLSPFETRAELLHRKAGLLAPKPTSAAMERGRLLEPAVLTWLTDRTKTTVAPDLSAATYVDADNDRHLCNPDAVTACGALLEAKTTSDRTTSHGWGRAGTDQIPDHYLCQVTWTAGLIGLDRWHLGVLSGAVNGRPSLSFAAYKGRVDLDLYHDLRAAADAFLSDLDALTARNQAA